MASEVRYLYQKCDDSAAHALSVALEVARSVGCQYIHTPHLLTALLFEIRPVFDRLYGAETTASLLQDLSRVSSVAQASEQSAPYGSGIPFSDECKRLIAYASEESERSGLARFSCAHLIRSFAREPRCVAGALLAKHAIDVSAYDDKNH